MTHLKRYSEWEELRTSEFARTALAIRACDREPVIVYSVNLPKSTNVTLESIASSMEQVQSLSTCMKYTDMHYSKEDNILLLERPTRNCISLYEYGALSTLFLIPQHASEDLQRYRYAFNCADGLSEIYLWRIIAGLLDTFVKLHNPYTWPDLRPRLHPLLSPSNVIVGPNDSFILEAAGIANLLIDPSRSRHKYRWCRATKTTELSSHDSSTHSTGDNLSASAPEYIDDIFSFAVGEQRQDGPNIYEIGGIMRSNRANPANRMDDLFRLTQIFAIELISRSLFQWTNDDSAEPMAFHVGQADDDFNTRLHIHSGIPPISVSSEDVNDDLPIEICDYRDYNVLSSLTEEITTKLDVFLLGITLIKLTVRNQCRHSILFQIIESIKLVDSLLMLPGYNLTRDKVFEIFEPITQNIISAGYSNQIATFITMCLIPDPRLRPSMHELKLIYKDQSATILKNSWCLYSLFRSRSYNMRNTLKYEIAKRGIKTTKKATELMKAVRCFENDLIPHYLDDLLMVDVKEGRTALMIAVEENNINAIPHLLSEAGVELVKETALASKDHELGSFDPRAPTYGLNTPDSIIVGSTALTMAIKAKNTAAIKLLAPLEIGFGGFTSLMAAVVANDYQAVCLYQSDAGKYCEGTTALMLAVLFGHLKCCELLLCELYMTDIQGRTVLSYGASIKDPSPDVKAVLAYLSREWLCSAPIDPLIAEVLSTCLIEPENSQSLIDSHCKTSTVVPLVEIPTDGIQLSAIIHALQLGNLHILQSLLPTHYRSTYQSLNLLELALKYKHYAAIDLISEFLVSQKIQMKVSSSTGIKVNQITPLMKAVLKNDIDGVLENREQYGRMIGAGVYFFYFNLRFTVLPINPNQQLTALMMAAKNGYISCVKNLLYELGIRNSLGNTALMFAIRSRKLDCIQYLLPERGIYNVYGRTPLMIAAETGFPEAIKLLYPDTRMTDNSGDTALLIALVCKNADCVALLKEQIGYSGVTPLMVYAALGDTEAVKACLETGGDSTNMLCKKSVGDWTALMFAVLYNNIECALLLMDEVGFSTTTKYTALLLAAQNRCYGAIRSLLIEADDGNMTLLMAYAAIGDLENVQANMSHVKKRNVLGWTALMYAAAAGHVDCVNALLEEIVLTDTNEETALMKAVENGNVACATLLLTLASQQSNKGHTALMKAAKKGCVDCIPLLSAELEIKDKKGRTVMMHAAIFGQLEFLRALPSDSVLERDISGRTARDFAEEYCHEECAKYLHDLESTIATSVSQRS